MPTSKQAEKRLRQNIKSRVRNDRREKRYKELEKEIRDLVADNKKAQAKKLLPKFYRAIDKAVTHGPVHQNKAARKKAQISKLAA